MDTNNQIQALDSKTLQSWLRDESPVKSRNAVDCG